jgi:2-polyprenyl-6-methoxyphenol hydroxylase-like FAD-dependent oxidoreductase
MQNRSVLISGIGIGGPTLAYWLLAHGFEPTLVERSPQLRTGGYIVDFWGIGYDIAERMGLVPDLRREGYDVTEVRFVDAAGKRVGGFQADVIRKLTGGRYVSLLRSDLSKLIYEKIESRCETIFGDSIASMEQASYGVRVGFERGPMRRFDLVIGADGLHSAVRRLQFGTQKTFERYLGYTVAAFDAAGYRPRDDLVYVSHGVPGKQVSRFTMRNDRTMFLLVFATADALPVDPHDVLAQKAVLQREFDGVGWECPEILAALEQCDELYFDRVSQIRMDRWSQGRVGLVGDAAFCPSLLAGEGSALAITAAYVLAGELANSGGRPEEAFTRYESVLRSFIMDKQTAAERFAVSFAPKTRWGLFLRNQITRTFNIPGVAYWVIGRSLQDRLVLPAYPV